MTATTISAPAQRVPALLTGAEVAGLILLSLLAIIFGGWSAPVLAIAAGGLVGMTVPRTADGLRRAVMVGTISVVAVLIMVFIHNTVIVTLPKQERVPAEAMAWWVYGVSLVLGIGTAALLAWLRAQANPRLGRYGLIGVLLVAATVLPFYAEWTRLLWMASIIVALTYAVQALGLNIVAGYAGMLDLGYVAFFAIGGYTAAFLNSNHFDIYITFWLLIWVAAAAAALFGLILGAPVIPLRGDYLAIVTLGFGEIVPVVFRNLEAVAIFEPFSNLIAYFATHERDGGLCLLGCEEPLNMTNGIQGISPVMPGGPETFGLVQFAQGAYTPWYFLILAILLLTVFLVYRLRHSRLGRSWVAIREDELAAAAMGINPIRSKLLAFMLGAMFSGMAGAFFFSFVSFVAPTSFSFAISVTILCMVILGGSGNIAGVILGALIIMLSDRLVIDQLQIVVGGVLQVTVFQAVTTIEIQRFLETLLNASQYKQLLFGLILVLMMRFRPQGLLPSRE